MDPFHLPHLPVISIQFYIGALVSAYTKWLSVIAVSIISTSFPCVTGLVRSYLKSQSSNLERRYTIECLAVSPAPACLHAGAGLTCSDMSELWSGVQSQELTRDWHMPKLLPLPNQDVFWGSAGDLLPYQELARTLPWGTDFTRATVLMESLASSRSVVSVFEYKWSVFKFNPSRL
jgi:hypothetical protein